MKLNDNFAKNLNLLTSEGKYNFNAYLLADENNISIKLVKYLGTNKMELIENHEYGYCCIITATNRILERLVAENTVYAKIEYKGRNKELIRVFKDVDLIENIGSGVLRILEAYDKSCFIFMDHFLRVSFKYRKNPFEYENNAQDNGVLNGVLNDLKNITENEKIVIEIITKKPNISQKDIANESKIPYRTIQRTMSVLKDKGIIERIGSNKAGYWKIKK